MLSSRGRGIKPHAESSKKKDLLNLFKKEFGDHVKEEVDDERVYQEHV